MDNSLKQKELEIEATIHSEEMFRAKVFSLRKDTLYHDSFPPHDWYVVEHPGAVGLIPVKEDGKLLLIKQWRRAIEKIIYEIPAGTLDENESPEICAQRELQEEISYKAKTLIPLGGIYPSPGFCDEYIYLYIAKSLSPSSLPSDPHEGIDVIEVDLNQVIQWIDTNEIVDGKTIIGILRYQRWLQTNG